MSAFDKDAANKPGAADLITEDFLGHLVGDGKKFGDHESLAKGKYESDLHVTNLERQLAELREDVDQGAKITELMELVRKQNEPPKDPNKPPVVPDDTSSGQMTEEELKALIATHVSERDRQTYEARNLEEVDTVLTTKFGDSAGRVLHDKATGLGMSVDEMRVLASKNTKAFFRLMGLDGDNKSTDTGTLLGKTQRSEGVQNKGTARNFAFYQAMRRDTKTRALYYSPKMQQQMMDDRAAMGAEVFDNNS